MLRPACVEFMDMCSLCACVWGYMCRGLTTLGVSLLFLPWDRVSVPSYCIQQAGGPVNFWGSSIFQLHLEHWNYRCALLCPAFTRILRILSQVITRSGQTLYSLSLLSRLYSIISKNFTWRCVCFAFVYSSPVRAIFVCILGDPKWAEAKLLFCVSHGRWGPREPQSLCRRLVSVCFVI